MNEFLENLKREAAENPIVAMGVAAGLLTALSKLMSAATETKKARSWDREVARRAANDMLKKK